MYSKIADFRVFFLTFYQADEVSIDGLLHDKDARGTLSEHPK